jgi:hypothetical protein
MKFFRLDLGVKERRLGPDGTFEFKDTIRDSQVFNTLEEAITAYNSQELTSERGSFVHVVELIVPRPGDRRAPISRYVVGKARPAARYGSES